MRQELSSIIAFLEETPERVARLCDGLDVVELRLRGEDGSFSFMEHICHLRDLELEGYGSRIEKILSEDLPPLADMDGASLARERRYNLQPFDESMQQFAEARTWNAFVLKGITDEMQFERRGVLEGVGEITLSQLVSMMCEHDRIHREELERLREYLISRRVAEV
jgi:hypothetical protein